MSETPARKVAIDDQIAVTPAVAEVLESTGLAYSSDSDPGIRREGAPSKFRYVDANGRPVKDARTLERIDKLVLPPAWTDVWICASPRGHLQATGRDVRGRKQYHYHAKWRKERDSNKFDRLAKFARALPAIRVAVERDLAKSGLPREKVIATMVSLLDRTSVRIGGERYRRENGSYGLTTLRNRHVEVQGERIRIRFRGKSGKEHDIALFDRRIAGIVRRCRDLPGYELFQYVEDGVVHSIGASDVNAYLKDAAGEDYTAKDFRTWGATVIAANAIIEAQQPTSSARDDARLTAAIRRAADTLGNTRCRVPQELRASGRAEPCAGCAGSAAPPAARRSSVRRRGAHARRTGRGFATAASSARALVARTRRALRPP